MYIYIYIYNYLYIAGIPQAGLASLALALFVRGRKGQARVVCCIYNFTIRYDTIRYDTIL